MIFESVDQIDFTVSDCPTMPLPGRVAMATPTHYDVQYVINPHMTGHVGNVDRIKALRQWETLRDTYRTLGMEVHSAEGVEGLYDMVFAANAAAAFLSPDGKSPGVIMSRMATPPRYGESIHYERFFHDLGVDVRHLPEGLTFEGGADAIWHPGRRLIWGGYGQRTDRATHDAISSMLDVPVIPMRLDDEAFYHLDTCLCALDERTALICPAALRSEDISMVHRLFERVIEVPEAEARERLGCNAHCPDGRHVLLQIGCPQTMRRLQDAGFEPVEIDTGEFLKAGASVYCMKLTIW